MYYLAIILCKKASVKNNQNKIQDMTKWATSTTIKKVTYIEPENKKIEFLQFCAKYFNPTIYLLFSVCYFVYYLLIFV